MSKASWITKVQQGYRQGVSYPVVKLCWLMKEYQGSLIDPDLPEPRELLDHREKWQTRGGLQGTGTFSFS